MIWQKALILIIGYCFGLIQTGYFYGRARHVDLHTKGSGNTGTTNALRVMGKKAGAVVFLGDFLKCLVPTLLIRLVIAPYLPEGQAEAVIYAFYMGLGVVLGHNFPCYLHFQGGKGIACTGAMVIVLDPLVAVVGFAVFVVTVLWTGYVSLGSLIGVFLSFTLIILHALGWNLELSNTGKIELIILSLITVFLAFYKHRANIVRLCNGTENKFNTKRHKTEEK